MNVPDDKVVAEPDAHEWRGRFPYNEIISLLDVNRPFNLAESTSQDLTVGDVLDLAGLETLRGLKLGYGRSAGSAELREEIAKACQVPVEYIVTTQGTALGLFLLAFETCRPGDEAVLATPCFPPSRDCLLGTGVTVREVRLTFEHNYRLDLDAHSASLSTKTRLVSLASPQNPSGVQTSRATIEKVLALLEASAPKAILFVDETHRQATYGNEAAPDTLAGLHPARHHGVFGLQSIGCARSAHGRAHGGERRSALAPDRSRDRADAAASRAGGSAGGADGLVQDRTPTDRMDPPGRRGPLLPSPSRRQVRYRLRRAVLESVAPPRSSTGLGKVVRRGRLCLPAGLRLPTPWAPGSRTFSTLDGAGCSHREVASR
jgi:Aminotransferase class I and II